MSITRYDIGRRHGGGIGVPAIVQNERGNYVRYADHQAQISELQAELAGVERIVVAQTVTITELRTALNKQEKP